VGAVALAAAGAAAAWWAVSVRGPQREALQALEEYLHDPESARLKDVRRVASSGAICGRLNAKNRMGGYSGYRDFIVFPDGDVRVEPDPDRTSTTADEIRNWGVLFDGNCFELTR
jgi:hypothetical protein